MAQPDHINKQRVDALLKLSEDAKILAAETGRPLETCHEALRINQGDFGAAKHVLTRKPTADPTREQRVMELVRITSVGRMDAARALDHCGGDVALAEGYLRFRGAAVAIQDLPGEPPGSGHERWLMSQAHAYAHAKKTYEQATVCTTGARSP